MEKEEILRSIENFNDEQKSELIKTQIKHLKEIGVIEEKHKIILSKEDAISFLDGCACPPPLNDALQEAFEKYHADLNLRLNTIENRLDSLETSSF